MSVFIINNEKVIRTDQNFFEGTLVGASMDEVTSDSR